MENNLLRKMTKKWHFIIINNQAISLFSYEVLMLCVIKMNMLFVHSQRKMSV